MRRPRSWASGASNQSPSAVKTSDCRSSPCMASPGASGALVNVRSSRPFTASTTWTWPSVPFTAMRAPSRVNASETGAMASSELAIDTDARTVSAGQLAVGRPPQFHRRRVLSGRGEQRAVGREDQAVDAARRAWRVDADLPALGAGGHAPSREVAVEIADDHETAIGAEGHGVGGGRQLGDLEHLDARDRRSAFRAAEEQKSDGGDDCAHHRAPYNSTG